MDSFESCENLENTEKNPVLTPQCLLDFNWNDDDCFMLEIFKKVFGTEECDEYLRNLELNSKTEDPPKLDSNVTEIVKVPSSAHVSQILGAKGNKIRTLRQCTNTFIKSPLPRDEPIFVIRGKKSDVSKAVQAIREAADFFSDLEKEKKSIFEKMFSSNDGQIILVKLQVPEKYIGLVIGIQGNNIKEIEKQTKTFIQSPRRNYKPIFIINGSARNCEKAINFISRYLIIRGVGPTKVKTLETFNNFYCDYFFILDCLEEYHFDFKEN